MGMTLTQKILAHHAGLAQVKAGQLINAKLDIVLGNDITTPVAINEFEKAGFTSVFDKTRRAFSAAWRSGSRYRCCRGTARPGR